VSAALGPFSSARFGERLEGALGERVAFVAVGAVADALVRTRVTEGVDATDAAARVLQAGVDALVVVARLTGRAVGVLRALALAAGDKRVAQVPLGARADLTQFSGASVRAGVTIGVLATGVGRTHHLSCLHNSALVDSSGRASG